MGARRRVMSRPKADEPVNIMKGSRQALGVQVSGDAIVSADNLCLCFVNRFPVGF